MRPTYIQIGLIVLAGLLYAASALDQLAGVESELSYLATLVAGWALPTPGRAPVRAELPLEK
jgi:hypothetical protein